MFVHTYLLIYLQVGEITYFFRTGMRMVHGVQFLIQAGVGSELDRKRLLVYVDKALGGTSVRVLQPLASTESKKLVVKAELKPSEDSETPTAGYKKAGTLMVISTGRI